MKTKEILIVTTYPPRKCGIASFSEDLVESLKQNLDSPYQMRVCALESESENDLIYDSIVKYKLNTEIKDNYEALAHKINADADIDLVFLNHESNLYTQCEKELLNFYFLLKKPIVTLFHMITPNPTEERKIYFNLLATYSDRIIVMNNLSNELFDSYDFDKNKIKLIPHGTHTVKRADKEVLKEKYNLSGRTILSTFGLIASHKNIEVALQALPMLVHEDPSILFLVIGQTHPSTLSWQGEGYRNALQERVEQLQLTDNVKFINEHVELPILLEYLQLTDLYLFTAYVPSQTVSGTLLYALSCGCPVVSTKIPCTSDVLKNYPQISFEHNNPNDLATSIKKVLGNKSLQESMRISGLDITNKTSWKQIAISYCSLFEDINSRSLKES